MTSQLENKGIGYIERTGVQPLRSLRVRVTNLPLVSYAGIYLNGGALAFM